MHLKTGITLKLLAKWGQRVSRGLWVFIQLFILRLSHISLFPWAAESLPLCLGWGELWANDVLLFVPLASRWPRLPWVDHMVTLIVWSHLDPAAIRTQLVYGSLCQNVPFSSVQENITMENARGIQKTLAASRIWTRTKGRGHSKHGNEGQREQTDGGSIWEGGSFRPQGMGKTGLIIMMIVSHICIFNFRALIGTSQYPVPWA